MERKLTRCENDTEGFTPVRRRLSSVNTTQRLGDSEKEWTAARCNRLLRALKSRVAILNKDAPQIQGRTQGRGTNKEVKAGTSRKADQDTDWTRARKKPKRTYSTRGGRSNNAAGGDQRTRKSQSSTEARHLLPGEVSVATPILSRARGQILSTEIPAMAPLENDKQELRLIKRMKLGDGQPNFYFSKKLRDIQKDTPPSRYNIYEGIYHGLDALLKATNPDGPQQGQVGPKSLLSLCLRTIPRYITQEEELFAAFTEETKSKSAINIRDISTEIYDELEAFGSNGKGWKHLRSIVRLHGIQLISDAIRSGSLDAEFVSILITLCIHTKSPKEAEILLSSLLSSVKLPEPKSVFIHFDDEPTTRPLSMLWHFVEITGSLSFQYRQLSASISSGILPLSWLATREFRPVWTRAIQDLSEPNDTNVLQFMDTVLPRLARSSSSASVEARNAKGGILVLDAVKQTFVSLLTTLTSIVILSKSTRKQTETSNPDTCTSEYGHIITLLRSCLIQWKLFKVFNVQGTLLVMTNLILGDPNHRSPESGCDLADTLLHHLCHISKSPDVLSFYHEIVKLVCSIARCCGRGASNSGFQYLQNLHHILENVISDRDTRSRNIVHEIIADSALAFAQDAPDRIHLDYADTMEARVHRIETKSRLNLTTGHSDSSRVGFRWEEGISEWVTATPSVTTGKYEDLTEYPQAQQSDCQTPFRPCRRKVKKSASLRTIPRVTRSTNHISNTRFGIELVQSSPVNEACSSTFDDDSDGDVADSTSFDAMAGDHGDSEDDSAGREGVVFELASSHDASGDELASESPVQSLSNGEGSKDELPPCSTQINLKADSEQDSYQSNVSLVDESSVSALSADCSQSSNIGSTRRHIDRVPRLNRRVLRSSLHWQLFVDESDDELSFTSISSEGDSVLQDITNKIDRSTWRQQPNKWAHTQKNRRGLGDDLLGDSEDELCI